MKIKSTGLLLALGIFFPLFTFGTLSSTSALAAASEVSSRPILFVHGFNPFGLGLDCKHDWKVMEDGLTEQGYTGPKITIGYYFNDRNCDVKTSPHGSILTHISDLSKDLAWYIYDEFSSKDIDIDVVAHSMGGLMIRYALYRSAVGDSDFPPYLKVSHVATLGSPFTGYSLLAETCHVVFVNIQCNDMFPLSSFIKDLKNPEALLPQGPDGTIWSNVGSNASFADNSDGVVNSSSATSMPVSDASKLILPWHMFVFHSNYTHNKTVIANVGQNLALTAQGASEARSLAVTMDQRFRVPAALELSARAKADAVVSRDEVIQDFSQVSSDHQPGRIEPYLENGQAAGVRFTNILAGGLFARMGIQEGDVVRGCAQENVNSPFEALDSIETSTEPVFMKFCVVREGALISKQILVQ
jgi:hypothetical protein